MSIRHASHTRHLAIALFVSTIVGMTLSAASADSPTAPTQAARIARQPRQPVAACRTIDRPKHTIRKCGCASSPLSGIASIDGAEILSLLTGDQGCRSLVAPRK